MSSTVAVVPQGRIEWNDAAWLKGAIVAAAFAAVFYNVLYELGFSWYHDSNWSHGWIVPLFSAYLVYTRWEVVERCPIRHTWIGLLIMLGGLATYQYSLWGLVIGYLRPLSMLVCLLGVIIFLCGLPVMRHVWFPWLYLFFAVPLPKGVHFRLTEPLRRFAATVSATILGLNSNANIDQKGLTIHYSYKGNMGGLDVADACSGMRSMITLCALGTAVAFISDRPWWQRAVMLASCVPIAIFSNVLRIVLTGVLQIYIDPSLATGTPHMALGLITMGIGLLMFMGLGWLLSNLTTDAAGGDEADPAAA